MVSSSRRMSNTSFSQRMVFASHPPHERMTRNFKASSAYCRLDFQSSMLPQMERVHTTPMPTKREKTLLDRMSKQWRWICSCGSSVRSSFFRISDKHFFQVTQQVQNPVRCVNLRLPELGQHGYRLLLMLLCRTVEQVFYGSQIHCRSLFS